MDETIGQMLGQQDIPPGQPMAEPPAPIQMDQATLMQLLQMLVQSQQPQPGPPMPPPGMPPQGPDPRVAQALMAGGMA